ncbi:RNA polymerase sigma factor RpoD/SigA [Chondromyces apiculatus]|uniref:RNA polymerase sigma factor n=1 Tax=Chondromyces apiculatus DSM 436 TaxID=1192034 RepID=A0A017THJ1_9BACT|nr:RNA polymerase sigma factor RpoD/SigA [Chondromyces apiculatus]EYF08310.1 RNA polymerase sigma factor RpoD [Chondromyces apiculatus DSM 436]
MNSLHPGEPQKNDPELPALPRRRIVLRPAQEQANLDATPAQTSDSLSAPPASRVRPARARDLDADFASRDATDLYLAELSGSQPLTRDGEVELGRRIEAGERAALDAWVYSPVALRVFGEMAEDVQVGSVTIQDLLLNPDADDPASQAIPVRLAQLLQLARSLSKVSGPIVPSALSDLAAGLCEVRLDPSVGERIDNALREAVEAGGAEASGARATLSALRRARAQTARAKAELVQANLRLVMATARHYQRRGVPLLDLVQEGNLGLMRAADKFDYRRGYRFSTYAGWWIKQAIERALLYQGRIVKMPVHLADSRRKVLRSRKALSQENAREPSPEEIAEHSGLPLAKVKAVRDLSMEPISLDAPIDEEGDARYGDFLASDGATPDEALTMRRMMEQTRDLLDGLTPREREVLRLRYGLDGEADHTLEEIGRSFSLSRERIRQIESKALEKLRSRSRDRHLASYLES